MVIVSDTRMVELTKKNNPFSNYECSPFGLDRLLVKIVSKKKKSKRPISHSLHLAIKNQKLKRACNNSFERLEKKSTTTTYSVNSKKWSLRMI